MKKYVVTYKDYKSSKLTTKLIVSSDIALALALFIELQYCNLADIIKIQESTGF